MNAEKLICVIEDNTPIRKLYCTLLKRAGYETVDFEEGKPAIEWLSVNSARAIIMDILLPDMNGTDLYYQVRQIEIHSATPIIAITGFATTQDRQKFVNIGFTGYIPKPINTTTFVSDVENIINQK